MTNIVKLPTAYFPDPLRGFALSGGKVFIGVVDLDPTVLANRIVVTVLEEDGTLVPIATNAQPFILNDGGLFVFNGSVVQLQVDSDFSMTVQDSADAQQYFFPDSNSDVVIPATTTNRFPLKYTDGVSGDGLSGTDIEVFFDITLAIGDQIITDSYDSNAILGSNGLFQYTGNTVVGKAGNAPDADGFFYSSTGSQFENTATFLNAKQWGAEADGVADDTSAIQAAIDFIGAKGTLILPSGTYKVTSTLTISVDRFHLVGEGRGSTIIDFEPVANDTCILIDQGTNAIVQGSVTGISFFSNDITFTKIAIDLIDGSAWNIENVGTQFPHWAGAGSIFLKVQGRDNCTFNNMDPSADRPIVIGIIPAPHTPAGISIDQCNFNNLYLTGRSGFNIVEIETGVNLTQVSFTGRQAWVGGDHGLLWIDTTSTSISNGLVLDNIRYEQTTDATAYLVRIEHNTNLQGLSIRSGQGGDRNGFYLRKVQNVKIDSFYYTSTTLEALNIDATVSLGVVITNCFWQAGSTATVVGQRIVYASPLNPNTGALPPNITYDSATNALETSTIGPVINGFEISLDDAEIHDLVFMVGYTLVSDSGRATASYVLRGSSDAVVEINDWSGLYTPTKDNAGTTNIYSDGGIYRLQNNRGGTLTYSITQIGFE